MTSMLMQVDPYFFPYSVLDWGLAVVALVVMGVMVYAFSRVAMFQHKAVNEHTEKYIETLDRLVAASRGLADQVNDQNERFEDLRSDIRWTRELVEAVHFGHHAPSERRPPERGGYSETRSLQSRARGGTLP